MAYDPLAIESTRAYFGDRITYSVSIRECIAGSPICVITTPDKKFKEIDEGHFTNDSCTIIDCWRLLTNFRPGANTTYVPLGVNVQAPIKRQFLFGMQQSETLREAEPVLANANR